MEALEGLHRADTPSFLQRGLSSEPPVSASKGCGPPWLGTPLWTFPLLCQQPFPLHAPPPIPPQLEGGIWKNPSQAQSAVLGNKRWAVPSTAFPSLLCLVAGSGPGNQLLRHLKCGLTHWALVEFPWPCLSLPICKMGGILIPTSQG